jgi:NADPH:quinone reductase-like Zn-dependent oxidoreductase
LKKIPKNQKTMSKMNKFMRAVVCEAYGAPKEVMKLVADRRVPTPNADQVLVRVESCSVNAADRHMVRANYFIIRALLGLFSPGCRVLGMDLAGTVSHVGANVRDFRAGDAVAADVRQSYGGGFAEYAVVNVENLVKKPAELSFQQAATVPISGQAAMMGVTLCRLKKGDKILISGASGGVGSFGVQIAKAQGAHVTALCSTAKMDAVKSWGADIVIDYTQVNHSITPFLFAQYKYKYNTIQCKIDNIRVFLKCLV